MLVGPLLTFENTPVSILRNEGTWARTIYFDWSHSAHHVILAIMVVSDL